jgi:hypothetical protein
MKIGTWNIADTLVATICIELGAAGLCAGSPEVALFFFGALGAFMSLPREERSRT